MKQILLLLSWFMAVSSASAAEEALNESKVTSKPLKIESRTTEPTPMPESEEQSGSPLDEPPVLSYGAEAIKQESVRRVPASATPEKYVDHDLGVACYYLLPPQILGVATQSSPAISCVKLPEKIPTPPRE